MHAGHPGVASVDLVIQHYGTISLVSPLTPAAQAWCGDHLVEGTTFGMSVAVERRFVQDILAATAAAGLTSVVMLKRETAH